MFQNTTRGRWRPSDKKWLKERAQKPYPRVRFLVMQCGSKKAGKADAVIRYNNTAVVCFTEKLHSAVGSADEIGVRIIERIS